MKILKKVLLWLVIVVVAVSILAQLLPGKWEVTRTVVVNTAPDRIYPLIADIQNWREWNSFSTNDPDIVHTYPAEKSGVGAEDHWKSKQFGDGSAKIISANPALGITYELRFNARPDVAIGTIAFGKVEEGRTTVVYSVAGESGRNPLIRILTQFSGKFLGPYFEESLAQLKALAEAASDDAADATGDTTMAAGLSQGFPSTVP